METIDPERAVAHLCAADPVLAQLIAQVGPFTLERRPHGFTTLVNAIVSQQISVKAAAAIMARLVAAVGEMTPDTLLALSADQLRALGLSYQKARYALDLAARVHAGSLVLEQLEQLADEAIIAQLVQVKGIGRWTAEMYLIFGLGRADVLPVDDLGLRQGVQRAYGLEVLPVGATISAIAEPWRPYRSVATWYFWRGLSNS